MRNLRNVFSASYNVNTNIVKIALFGLLLSISTQMLYSHLALYLKYELHLSEMKIAYIDGFVEFLSYVIKIFSGIFSDYLKNRNILIAAGAILAGCIKPFFAFASGAVGIFSLQICERISSGIQSSPKDALVVDYHANSNITHCFGYVKLFKSIGAVLGSGIACAIMYYSKNNYGLLFCIAMIPSIISIYFIRNLNSANKIKNKFTFSRLQFNKQFWSLIFLAFILEFNHYSESMLVIRASHFTSHTFAGLTVICTSVGQMFFAHILIYLNNLNLFILLRYSIIFIIIANTCLFFATGIELIYFGIFLLSGQHAIIQILFLSNIGKIIPDNVRGAAIGIFYCTIGLSYMLSSMIVGEISTLFSLENIFIYAIVVGIISYILISFKKMFFYIIANLL